MRLSIRAPLAAALIVAPLLLAACGERARLPSGGSAAAGNVVTPSRAPVQATTTTTSAVGTATFPTLPRGAGPSGTVPATRRTTASGGEDPTERAIVTAYETYLTDLSGLDDNLSQGYVEPLAAVTTTRLAQASVRQAAAILAAQEHGVGTLRDDHVTVVMTGPASAALADCQDERDFYLVSDTTGTPDTFVERGDFAGSAQLVLQNGRWLVDVFTTTHVACAY